MTFLSSYRIVEEKKRYEKLNDAAYSALKYRDCAANVFFKRKTRISCDNILISASRSCIVVVANMTDDSEVMTIAGKRHA